MWEVLILYGAFSDGMFSDGTFCMGTIYFMFLTAVLSIRVVPMTYSSVKTVLGKCMIQKFSLIILICKSLFYVHYLLSVFNIINLKWGFGVPRSVSPRFHVIGLYKDDRDFFLNI